MNASRLAVAVAVALGAASACGLSGGALAAASCPDPIPIVLTTPLSSGLALLGIQARNGMQVAVDEINDRGGVGGHKLALSVEDTPDATSAINALNRLVEKKPVVAYSSMISPQVFAQADVMRKSALPFLVGATNAKIVDQGIANLFRISVHDGQLAAFAPRYVVETLGAKRPAIIAVADDYGLGASKGFQEAFAQLHVSPVAVESYAPSDKDMTAQLLDIADKKADVVLVWGRPGDVTLVLKQMRQLGLSMPRIGNTSVVAATTLNNLTEDEADGVMAIGGMIPQGVDSDTARRLAARALEKFKVPADNFTVSYYDSVFLLKKIIENVGCDAAAIRTELAATKGWKGTLINYTADSKRDLAHTVGVYRMKGKTPVLISTLTETGI
jgi:branched-chain amino acid transport system substrate-binding protein